MAAAGTRVVITGTGTPIPAPGRAGPGVLVSVGDLSMQFDVGRSTVMRLAESGTKASEIDAIFITHHHSDHTSDLFDLLQTSWLLNSEHQPDLIVPAGVSEQLARAVLEPFEGDIAARRSHRRVESMPSPNIRGFNPAASPEIIWDRGSTTVRAVEVRHEPVVNAVGYSIETPDGLIAISGDTIACAEVEELADGADVLIHEVARPELVPKRRHVGDYHTVPHELAVLAQRAKVKTLVLTHLWPAPKSIDQVEGFAQAVREGGFLGDIVVASDLTEIQLHQGSARIHIPENLFMPGLWWAAEESKSQNLARAE